MLHCPLRKVDTGVRAAELKCPACVLHAVQAHKTAAYTYTSQTTSTQLLYVQGQEKTSGPKGLTTAGSRPVGWPKR